MLTPEQAQARWVGVVIPLVTPFKPDGALDIDTLRANVQWLIGRGARLGNTIFLVAGSGGDFTVMNLEERLQTIRAVAEAAEGRVPIIAGAQSTDIRECIAIGRLCAALAVDAIQISAPYYYDVRPDDAVAWLTAIAAQARVGFALYNHFYSGTKYDLPLELMERLLDIPNSVGVKWASADIEKFYEGLRRFLPRAAVIDNLGLPVESHMRGCRAFVSHVPNFWPEFAWRVWDLLEAGQYAEARAAYDQFMTPYSRIIGRIAGATAGEAVFVRPFMAAAGLNGGCSRLPSRDVVVTSEVLEDIKELMARIRPGN